MLMPSFKISKTAIFQYLLIYMLYGLNGARWFVQYQSEVVLIVLIFFVIMGVKRYSLFSFEKIWFPLFLLIAIFFVRMISGGIGIDMWELYASQILIVYMVFQVDFDMALTRYIKFTTVMAVMSLMFWVIAQVNPDILQSMLTLTTDQNASFYGLWIYTLVPQHIERNTGIFTEPGRYQTVIISAILILAFFSNHLNITPKKQKKVFIVLIITLITIQSTTGYLGFMIILLGILIQRKKDNASVSKKALVVLSVLAIGFLAFDYWTNSSDSIIESTFFEKLADTDISDEYSSGGARLRAITICLEALLSMPWGAGLTNITNMIITTSMFRHNTAGAGLMTYFAALGIVPAIITIIWLIRPFVRYGDKVLLFVYIFIYINIGFAQTYAFYPSLLLIPVLLSTYNKHSVTISPKSPKDYLYR